MIRRLGIVLLCFVASAHAATLSLNCNWPGSGSVTVTSPGPCNATKVQDPADNQPLEPHAYQYSVIPGTSIPAMRVQINDNDKEMTTDTQGKVDRREVQWNAGENLCTLNYDGKGCWFGFSYWVSPDSPAGGDSGDIWHDSMTPCNTGMMGHQANNAPDACDVGGQAESWNLGMLNSNASCGPMRWRFVYQQTPQECTPSSTTVNLTDLGLIARGTHTYFVVYFRHSTRTAGGWGAGTTLNADGIVRVWMNGAAVIDHTNRVVGMNNDEAHQSFYAALYASKFKPTASDNGVTQPSNDIVSAYFGPMKVCDESVDATCSFADVNTQTTPAVVTLASAVITAANPNRIHAVVSNPGASPMIPASGITGFSYSCSGTSGAVTVTRPAPSSVYLTLNSGNFSSSDVCTISYSQATGNFTNSDGVELATTTGFAVTNEISAPATIMRQVAGRCTIPNVAEADWQNTDWTDLSNSCELPTNSSRVLRFSLRNEGGVYSGIPRLYCNDGGGEYLVGDSYGGNGVRLAVDEVLHGAVITTCHLPLSGTCVGGIRHASPSASFPPRNVSYDAAPVGIKQIEDGFAIETNLAVGASSTCRVKEEDNTAFTTYDSTVTLTVSAPTSRSVGGGL